MWCQQIIHHIQMGPQIWKHLDVVDDLLTPGTPRNKAYSTWRMEKPER